MCLRSAHLFVVDEHGRVEGLCSPVQQSGGLARAHVDQHALRQQQCGNPMWEGRGGSGREKRYERRRLNDNVILADDVS